MKPTSGLYFKISEEDLNSNVDYLEKIFNKAEGVSLFHN